MTQETFSVRSHHGSKSTVEKELQKRSSPHAAFSLFWLLLPLHYI